MIDIFNNKTAFLRLKPKKLLLLGMLFWGLFIILFFILINTQTYEHYLTKGYVKCKQDCYVISFVPSNIKIDKIKMNQKEINYTIHEKVIQINEDEMRSYYKLSFTCNEKLLENQIVELNFYYDKQSILKKI